MRGSALVIAIGAAAAFVVVGVGLGVKPAAETAIMLAAFGTAGLAAAELIVRNRGRMGPLRRQLVAMVGITTGQLLAIVVAFAELMFVSAEDAVLIMLAVAFSAAIGIRASQLMLAEVLSEVESIRDALVAVGAGNRDLRISNGMDDEIGELAEAADGMIQRLDTAERARRDLVAAVSHDLRTPVTSLRVLTEAIEDEVVDEVSRRRYLITMRTHVSALGALIDDLFELSRLEAGQIEWSVSRVELSELVAETVTAMRVQADAAGVRVFAEVPGDLAPTTGNPEKLQRVLFNLIQNAIRHTPADGSIAVRAEALDGRVEVEVADTGDGIPAPDRASVFEPSYRAGADASRSTEGAGLGLAISRAIVESHGGRIWLADSQSGTRVRFSLPRDTSTYEPVPG
ncbi:MAG: HAMP domain-containing sensor histidine kinase [Solirubrobacterales bacterium]